MCGACVRRVAPSPPPEASVTLLGRTATYRDWSKVSELCLVNAKTLESEFESMNALVVEFLGKTSAGPDGVWADEHIALLEEGVLTLLTPLDTQKRSLNSVSKAPCRFVGINRTLELTDLARKRIAEAPAVLEVVKAKKALAAWKEALPSVQEAAREKTCSNAIKGAKPANGPVLFVAFEDEKNAAEWHFCDGSKVVAAPGVFPTYQAPPLEKPPKRPRRFFAEKAYLDLQAKFPSADVLRAPKLPVKRAALRDDAPEPE